MSELPECGSGPDACYCRKFRELSAERNIQDEVRENQAARIRWLLHRATPEVYWEFTLNYVREHPFPVENPAEEQASADDV